MEKSGWAARAAEYAKETEALKKATPDQQKQMTEEEKQYEENRKKWGLDRPVSERQ
jgi:hypothetical protein